MKFVTVAENPTVPTPGHMGASSKEIAGPLADAKTCVVKLGTFEPGGTSEYHIHPRSEQIFYILEGALTLVGGDKREIVARPGQAVYIPAGENHAAFNRGAEKAVYVAVTAPPE